MVGHGVWEAAKVRMAVSGGNNGRVSVECIRGESLHRAHYACALPVHPDITAEMVKNAIEAEWTDDGYVFHRAKHGTHEDHETLARAAILGYFNPPLVLFHAENINADDEATRTRTAKTYQAMANFYGDALASLVENVRAVELGDRHVEPHPATGYFTDAIRAAVVATETSWKENTDKAADLMLITPAGLTYVKTALVIPVTALPWADSDEDSSAGTEEAEEE